MPGGTSPHVNHCGHRPITPGARVCVRLIMKHADAHYFRGGVKTRNTVLVYRVYPPKIHNFSISVVLVQRRYSRHFGIQLRHEPNLRTIKSTIAKFTTVGSICDLHKGHRGRKRTGRKWRKVSKWWDKNDVRNDSGVLSAGATYSDLKEKQPDSDENTVVPAGWDTAS
jgi:hypothetical protein